MNVLHSSVISATVRYLIYLLLMIYRHSIAISGKYDKSNKKITNTVNPGQIDKTFPNLANLLAANET